MNFQGVQKETIGMKWILKTFIHLKTRPYIYGSCHFIFSDDFVFVSPDWNIYQDPQSPLHLLH